MFEYSFGEKIKVCPICGGNDIGGGRWRRLKKYGPACLYLKILHIVIINSKKAKKYGMCAKPCKYWKIIYTSDNKPVEYCKLLNQILDIQDQVKDCGINDIFGGKKWN